MAGRKLGGHFEHLDQFVAPSLLRGVDPGDEDDGRIEPGGLQDPLDGVNRGIDPTRLIGREGGMRRARPLGQLAERQARP